MLRVLSLGAGVQSSALLLMSAAGEVERLDAAIFADTGWETPDTYAWLTDELVPRARAAEIPLYVVRRYDDGRDVRTRPWEMPLYITNRDGERGMIRRQCTHRFKIVPVRRQIRVLLDGPARPGSVEQWFGISFDEPERMRDSDVRYITHRYPLVERRLTRVDCHNWLSRRGLTAPRSACIGCPFRSGAEWLRIKRQPELWRQAVEVDRYIRSPDAVRQGAGAPSDFAGAAYLHPSRVPLDEAPIRNDDQLDLFGAGGCDGGHCGV
jgi:hypothetical protein